LKYYFFAAAGVGEGAGVAADDGRDHVPSIPITIVVAVMITGRKRPVF